MARRSAKASLPVTHSELSRDVYGFAVRPHHLQRYKEYAVIYKEEEAERSARWERFLVTYAPSPENGSFADNEFVTVGPEQKEQIVNDEVVATVRNGEGVKVKSWGSRKFETWGQIRTSLWPVERALCSSSSASVVSGSGGAVLSATELEPAKAESSNRYTSEDSADESEEEFYDVERSDVVQDGAHGSPEFLSESVGNLEHEEESCLWKEELDALVRGGVPMALRGELWQVFVGTTTRRVQGHYQALLTLLADGGGDSDGIGGLYSGTSTNYSLSESGILEKWTSQIEKDLPRTFPGHPALDEDGRNALRHLLTAYARHNPDVGYCQAMNFFAALLLLMMPEENAFWTLTGIIDGIFEGYYSEKMVESQVDQLVLEDLVRKHFPKLVNHLDTLGVQIAWVSGPWFLSIFVNILPWESVLRVWDVLLYERNRSILFRTALALIELHGSAIMATKDAGDAVATLQTLVGSTFDSSQLVLIACMGYQSVNGSMLQELALKHRPQVLAALSERSMERSIWHGANGSVTIGHRSDAVLDNAKTSLSCVNEDGSILPAGDVLDGNLDDQENSAADLVEQVKWLKVELSRALEESKAATVRAEELESAFMELVKEDNRRLLSAKVETLEAEVARLRRALAEKEEQENAMLQVMLRMEHEQRLTEDARRYAEEDAAAQRHATSLLQAKYEDAVSSLARMEKRTVMAETMLEATLQYQALDNDKVALSKRTVNAGCEEESSRWSWPRISPNSSTGSAGSMFSRKSDSGDLITKELKGRNADPQLVDPQKQGVMSRRFSLAWLEKHKGKVGTSKTQTALSSSQQGLEQDSSLSSVSMSFEGSFDSSQTPSCHDESHENTDTSTAGEMNKSTDTHSNSENSAT